MNRSLYSELVTALQLFLKEEFPKGYQLPVTPETFDFFLREAKEGKGKKNIPTPPPSPITQTPAKGVIPLPPLPALTIPKPKVESAKKIQKEPEQKRERLSKAQQPIQIEVAAASHTEDSLDDLRRHIEALFPQLLLPAQPSDQLAKKRKEIWKEKEYNTAVLIIADDSLPQEHLQFLQNMAKAISERLAPALVITKTQLQQRNIFDSPAIKLVISDTPLPENGKRTILLKKISTYLSQPSEKRVLWQHICQALT